MNRAVWQKISLFLLLFVSAFYLYHYHSRLVILRSIAVEDLLIITALAIATFIFLAVQFKFSIEIFHLSLKFKEWFGLTVVNTMISYYTPVRGGLFARAYYLKKKYDLSYSRYLALLGGSYIINFFIASFGTIFFSFLTGLHSNLWNQKIIGLGVGLLVGTLCLGIILFKLCSQDVSFKPGRIGNVLNNFIEGINLFRKYPKVVMKISVIQFCVIVIMGGKLYWSFKAVGKDVVFLDVLVVQSLVVFSMLISITPGNLGVKEGVIGLLATQLHVSFGDAVLAASVDRGISMFMTFLLGMYYSKSLLKDNV